MNQICVTIDDNLLLVKLVLRVEYGEHLVVQYAEEPVHHDVEIGVAARVVPADEDTFSRSHSEKERGKFVEVVILGVAGNRYSNVVGPKLWPFKELRSQDGNVL